MKSGDNEPSYSQSFRSKKELSRKVEKIDKKSFRNTCSSCYFLTIYRMINAQRSKHVLK